MSPDQQIIAAALHLGAQFRIHISKGSKRVRQILTFETLPGRDFSYGARPIQHLMVVQGCNDCWIASDVPNYHTSLDAVAKLEVSILQLHKLDAYSEHIGIIYERKYESWVHMTSADQADAKITAEPDVRLEACLRTLNLYTPS